MLVELLLLNTDEIFAPLPAVTPIEIAQEVVRETEFLSVDDKAIALPPPQAPISDEEDVDEESLLPEFPDFTEVQPSNTETQEEAPARETITAISESSVSQPQTSPSRQGSVPFVRMTKSSIDVFPRIETSSPILETADVSSTQSKAAPSTEAPVQENRLRTISSSSLPKSSSPAMKREATSAATPPKILGYRRGRTAQSTVAATTSRLPTVLKNVGALNLDEYRRKTPQVECSSFLHSHPSFRPVSGASQRSSDGFSVRSSAEGLLQDNEDDRCWG